MDSLPTGDSWAVAATVVFMTTLAIAFALGFRARRNSTALAEREEQTSSGNQESLTISIAIANRPPKSSQGVRVSVLDDFLAISAVAACGGHAPFHYRIPWDTITDVSYHRLRDRLSLHCEIEGVESVLNLFEPGHIATQIERRAEGRDNLDPIRNQGI